MTYQITCICICKKTQKVMLGLQVFELRTWECSRERLVSSVIRVDDGVFVEL